MTVSRRATRPVVLKLGGELIEDAAKRRAMARAIVRVAAKAPLVVVHGGGREIDAALALAQIAKRQVDGLRITDQATLAVVVAVLAGTVNTELVATVNAAGGHAVGLTGADADVCLVKRAPLHKATTGERVDLGFVGRPVAKAGSPLIVTLVQNGFVPVIASIGRAKDGMLFNVNADTLASSLAARLGARRLVIAGGTAGVLDRNGRTVPVLDQATAASAIRAGTVNAGMVAKLGACREALDGGVTDVMVADGTRTAQLTTLLTSARTGRGPWTAVVS